MGRDGKREPKKIGYSGDLGLKCPACGCCDIRTRSTRRQKGWIYRFRACRNCGRSIHSKEMIDVERTGCDGGEGL